MLGACRLLHGRRRGGGPRRRRWFPPPPPPPPPPSCTLPPLLHPGTMRTCLLMAAPPTPAPRRWRREGGAATAHARDRAPAPATPDCPRLVPPPPGGSRASLNADRTGLPPKPIVVLGEGPSPKRPAHPKIKIIQNTCVCTRAPPPPRPGQECTTFHFDVKPDALHGALQRFAGFFTCPLVKQDAMEREVRHRECVR